MTFHDVPVVPRPIVLVGCAVLALATLAAGLTLPAAA
jgi:hypothetical protein